MKRMMVLLALLSAPVASGWAQSEADQQIRQLRLQVRQSMQMARDAQQDAAKASQAAETARSERDSLAGELESTEAQRSKLAASVGYLGSERKRLEAQVAELEASLAKERAAHEDTRGRLASQTRERLAAEASFARENQALLTCRQHNGELAGAAEDLLNAYEEKGVFSVLGEHEPFTGIGRVRLENLLETYRDKVGDAREPATPVSPAS